MTDQTKLAGLVEQMVTLHEAARGYEFDLVPSDGPIAQLALFMHEHGDTLAEAITALQAQVEAMREGVTKIDDLFGFAVQSDCENGVRCLNERAAKKYLADTPATRAVIIRAQKITRTLIEATEGEKK